MVKRKFIKFLSTALIASTVSAPTSANTILDLWISGLQFQLEIKKRRQSRQNRSHIVPAPYNLQAVATDQQMAIQALSLALAINRADHKYNWYNPLTNNWGGTVVFGPHQQHGCVNISNQIYGTNGQIIKNNFMVACRGGGNISTWIVDNKWVINSVFRTPMDQHGCRVQFADPKIPGMLRGSTTMRVCFNTQFKSWNVGG